MSYVRFDDDTPWHPRVQAMSDAEFRAWFTSICYASRYRTDGYLPEGAIPLVAPKQRVRDALIQLGAWDVNGAGMHVHDYLGHQRSKAQIEAQIEGGRRGAQGRWRP